MKRNEKSMFFPILINLRKFHCLVVGGGKVAQRKVNTLLNFNAKISVISPRICKPLKELSKINKIKIIQKSYHKDFLKDFEIIFCATDNQQINQSVYKDCKGENKLLNVADIPDLCDFILPAVVKRGDLSLAVSSQGRAPFFAAEIKNKLNHVFPSYYENIVDIAGNFRAKVLSSEKFKSSKEKQNALNKFFTINWKKVIEGEGKTGANKHLQKLLNDL
jgi:precorrin-2 dehydrogenase/sirohydrochlorin ferrochelatase